MSVPRTMCPFYYHDGGKSCETCACHVIRPKMPENTIYCLDCNEPLNPYAPYSNPPPERCNPCSQREGSRLRREAVLNTTRRELAAQLAKVPSR